MIISRTPFRVSFFGGGTDYPAWYRQYGGAVLSTAINKYCYITCRYLPPFFEHKTRVVYSKIEYAQRIEEIGHPAVREVTRFLAVERGLEIHHDGDLPARSGMGSSSSFTVGLLHALHALKGEIPSKQQLAKESIHIEQDCLKETVGSQDQIVAAYGGLNHISLERNGDFAVRPMTITPGRAQELNSHLMLFYTGIARTASVVAESYVQNLDGRGTELNTIRQMVDEGVTIISGNTDMSAFGKLLHESWQLKRSLSARVSNQRIEEMYEAALAAGALGGKLTGAGGGGFLLIFARPSDQNAVRQRLSRLLCVPFKFETAGSQIIFFDPEEDYAGEEERRVRQSIVPFEESIQPSTRNRN